MKFEGEILFFTPDAIRFRVQGREIFLPRRWGGNWLKLQRPAQIGTYDPGPAVISVPKPLAERKGLAPVKDYGHKDPY